MNVFISYSDADAVLARELADVLEHEGFEVWRPEQDVMPGDNWAAQLAQALESSSAMVVLLTRSSVESRAVKHEIEYGLANRRFKGRLVPVLIGQPDKWRASFPWILRRLKMVRLPSRNPSRHFQKIADALKAAA